MQRLFETLYLHGGVVFLTSNRGPKELYRTRGRGGLNYGEGLGLAIATERGRGLNHGEGLGSAIATERGRGGVN